MQMFWESGFGIKRSKNNTFDFRREWLNSVIQLNQETNLDLKKKSTHANKTKLFVSKELFHVF